MVTDALRLRVDEFLRENPAGAGLPSLAASLRDEDVQQLTLYRLFTEYLVRTASDDPLCDALLDTLDIIHGGPWAKGGDLFEKELTDEDVA
jgi:hypothetical protein